MGRHFSIREGLIFLAMVILVLLLVAAFSQGYSQGSSKIFSTSPNNVEFYDHGTLVVAIHLKDGTVTFGKGISPDDASKRFWDVLGKFYIQLCKRED